MERPTSGKFKQRIPCNPWRRQEQCPHKICCSQHILEPVEEKSERIKVKKNRKSGSKESMATRPVPQNVPVNAFGRPITTCPARIAFYQQQATNASNIQSTATQWKPPKRFLELPKQCQELPKQTSSLHQHSKTIATPKSSRLKIQPNYYDRTSFSSPSPIKAPRAGSSASTRINSPDVMNSQSGPRQSRKLKASRNSVQRNIFPPSRNIIPSKNTYSPPYVPNPNTWAPKEKGRNNKEYLRPQPKKASIYKFRSRSKSPLESAKLWKRELMRAEKEQKFQEKSCNTDQFIRYIDNGSINNYQEIQPTYIIRDIYDDNPKQLSLSECMHVDIRPHHVDERHRYTGPINNGKISYTGPKTHSKTRYAGPKKDEIWSLSQSNSSKTNDGSSGFTLLNINSNR